MLPARCLVFEHMPIIASAPNRLNAPGLRQSYDIPLTLFPPEPTLNQKFSFATLWRGRLASNRPLRLRLERLLQRHDPRRRSEVPRFGGEVEAGVHERLSLPAIQ